MLNLGKNRKLIDVLECIIDYRGKTPTKSESGVPLITAKVIKNGRIEAPSEFISENTCDSWMTRGIPRFGDVVLTTEAPLGEVAQIKTQKKLAFAQRVIVLRGKARILDNAFLKFYLQSPFGQNALKAKGSGSTVTGIKQSELRELEIPIPEFEEQRRIGGILSVLDQKIGLNLEMSTTLEKVAQAIFKSLKTNGIPKKLNEYVELNPRLSVKKGDLIKYVEMGDLPERGASARGFIFREFAAGSKFQQNDTLLARITPCLENGKTAFVDFLSNEEIAFGSTEFIVMRAKEMVSPYFVYLVARDEAFREVAIKSMVGTSGRQRVQTDVIASFDLNEITHVEMQRFHSLVKPIFEKLRQNACQIKTLIKVRDNLLPKLMSGQIRVRVETAD